ncbi:DUF262 domain-containing protein [Gluconobacter cerinus]|uniref:DUF262 domain-containing protein n=1 Tax=Gluconobacter cerinus TaxID=38307 RepID=UPI001B8CD7BD|nr:DUF262 domain-containing protein [Gluconobacter cerinus]MBS1032819.1 DUF262 domain-containing protein [Gluconobacter cerinus]
MSSLNYKPKNEEEKNKAEAQIRDLQEEVDYTVREYPIEILVQRYEQGLEEDINEIYIPDYQRDMVWEESRQSRFIESLVIGLPIPYLFVADVKNEDENLDGRLEIIDGTQRIRTLSYFLNDELTLQGLKKISSLNGFRFSDLPPPRQRRFKRITLRLIELTEHAKEETRRDMFDRINTGPVKLNDMETRRGAHPGPFIDFVNRLAQDSFFHDLAPISETQKRRYEYEELVARYFALYADYENYGRTPAGKVVSEFVGDYARRMNETLAQEGSSTVISELERQWYSMLHFVKDNFPYGFAKSPTARSTPRVRFEAIAVGSARALSDNPLTPGKNDVNKWLDKKEFKTLTTSDAANNRNKVLDRINFVRKKLSP